MFSVWQATRMEITGWMGLYQVLAMLDNLQVKLINQSHLKFNNLHSQKSNVIHSFHWYVCTNTFIGVKKFKQKSHLCSTSKTGLGLFLPFKRVGCQQALWVSGFGFATLLVFNPADQILWETHIHLGRVSMGSGLGPLSVTPFVVTS